MPAAAATITMELGVPFHSAAGKPGSQLRRAFEKDLKDDLARASGWIQGRQGGLPPSNFVVKQVSAGSVIVDAEILPNASGAHPDPWSVAATIHEQQFHPGSLLRTGILTKHTTEVTIYQHPSLPGAEQGDHGSLDFRGDEIRRSRLAFLPETETGHLSTRFLPSVQSGGPTENKVTVMGDWAPSPGGAEKESEHQQRGGTNSAISTMRDFDSSGDSALWSPQTGALSPEAPGTSRGAERGSSPEQPLYTRLGNRNAHEPLHGGISLKKLTKHKCDHVQMKAKAAVPAQEYGLGKLRGFETKM